MPYVSILLVAAGGAMGAVARYLLSTWVTTLLKNPWFPYGTLTVNVLGCLAIGALTGLADARNLISPEVRAFLVVGILGGFTTFSAFGNETMALVREGQPIAALANVGLQVVLSLVAVWAGYALSQSL